MTEQPLRLTDDEVLAIAVAAGSPWPGGVPTVGGDEADIVQAVFRGRRSLTVRSLIHADGTLDNQIQTLCGEVPGAPVYLAVYLADDPLIPTGWGTASMHYPTTSGWVMETVNPMGIHQFLVQPIEVHTSYIQAFLAAAEREGPPSTSDAPSWLCALAAHGDEIELAKSQRGSVSCQALRRSDETLQTLGEPINLTPPEATARLFDHLTGAATKL